MKGWTVGTATAHHRSSGIIHRLADGFLPTSTLGAEALAGKRQWPQLTSCGGRDAGHHSTVSIPPAFGAVRRCARLRDFRDRSPRPRGLRRARFALRRRAFGHLRDLPGRTLRSSLFAGALATHPDVPTLSLHGFGPRNTTRQMPFALRATELRFRIPCRGPVSVVLEAALRREASDSSCHPLTMRGGSACATQRGCWPLRDDLLSHRAAAYPFGLRPDRPAYRRRWRRPLSGRSGLAWVDVLRRGGVWERRPLGRSPGLSLSAPCRRCCGPNDRSKPTLGTQPKTTAPPPRPARGRWHRHEGRRAHAPDRPRTLGRSTGFEPASYAVTVRCADQ
jgi:hypothetical protein